MRHFCNESLYTPDNCNEYRFIFGYSFKFINTVSLELSELLECLCVLFHLTCKRPSEICDAL